MLLLSALRSLLMAGSFAPPPPAPLPLKVYAQDVICAPSGDVEVRTPRGLALALRAEQLMHAEAFSGALAGGFAGVQVGYHQSVAYASAPGQDDALIEVAAREWDGPGEARFTPDYRYMLGTTDPTRGVFVFLDPTEATYQSVRVDGPLKSYQGLVWVDERRALIQLYSKLELIRLEGAEPVVEGAWVVAEPGPMLASDGSGRAWVAAATGERLALYTLDLGAEGPTLTPQRAVAVTALAPAYTWGALKVVDGLPILMNGEGALLALGARRDHSFALELDEGEVAEGFCARRQGRTLEVVALTAQGREQRLRVQRFELERGARVRLPELGYGELLSE